MSLFRQRSLLRSSQITNDPSSLFPAWSIAFPINSRDIGRSAEVKKTDDDEDEENLVPKGKGAEKEERVRIYEGIKEQLVGSDIKTTGAPLIHYEVTWDAQFKR